MTDRPFDPAPSNPLDLLTDVERAVFVLVGTGMSYRAVARVLRVDVNTAWRAHKGAREKLTRVVLGKNYGIPDVLGVWECQRPPYRVRGVDDDGGGDDGE